MAEAEERLAPVAVVAAVAHQQSLRIGELSSLWLGMEDRGVSLLTRDRDRQPPPGLGHAEQAVCERLTEGLSWEPHLDDRRDVVGPGHEYGHARIDDDDGLRLRGGYATNQLVLASRQRQRIAIVSLAFRPLG